MRKETTEARNVGHISLTTYTERGVRMLDLNGMREPPLKWWEGYQRELPGTVRAQLIPGYQMPPPPSTSTSHPPFGAHCLPTALPKPASS